MRARIVCSMILLLFLVQVTCRGVSWVWLKIGPTIRLAWNMNRESPLWQVARLVTGCAVMFEVTVVLVIVGVSLISSCGLKGPGTRHLGLKVGSALLQVSVIMLEVLPCVRFVTVCM